MDKSSRKASSELEIDLRRQNRSGKAEASERKLRRERSAIYIVPPLALEFLLAIGPKFSPILAFMCANRWNAKLVACGLAGRIAVIFLTATSLVQAQQLPQKGALSSLRVHGSATLSVMPDQAQFDIAIVTQASIAKAATDENTRQSDALVGELSAAFPKASVKGVNFSVNPNYQYPQGGTPTISGYMATNTVRLLLEDLSKLRTVIDIAINAGASSINRLSFTVKSEDSARAQALAAASHQAQASAAALAASLQLRLGRLLTVEEGQPVIVSPPRELSFEKLQSTSVAPISPGTIDVHADVDITYEVTSTTTRQTAPR